MFSKVTEKEISIWFSDNIHYKKWEVYKATTPFLINGKKRRIIYGRDCYNNFFLEIKIPFLNSSKFDVLCIEEKKYKTMDEVRNIANEIISINEKEVNWKELKAKYDMFISD